MQLWDTERPNKDKHVATDRALQAVAPELALTLHAPQKRLGEVANGSRERPRN